MAAAALIGVPASAAGSGIWLSSPADGATIAPTEAVSFEFGTDWLTGVFPGRLGLQVSRDSRFIDLVVDDVFECPASFEPSCPGSAVRGPFAEGTYYWRIRFEGFRELGPPEWVPSEVRTFVVASAPPPAPPSNQLPVAQFSMTPNPARVGELVSFDGTASADPDGSIASFAWSFGNGNGAAGSPLAAATFSEAGRYAVRLVIIDDRGAQTETSAQLVVEAADGVPPSPPVGPPAPPPREPQVDTTAPAVRALASQGRRGTSVRLRYLASDESGWTTVEATIRLKGRVLATLHGVARGRGNTVRSIAWRAAVRAGALRFCVRARDRDGNTSATSCALVRVR